MLVAMHTALAATEAAEQFNADYYIAVVTVFPIIMIASNVLASFASSFPPELEDTWPDPLYFLITFMYLFTPAISATGIVAGVVALILREENPVLQWCVFGALVAVLAFMAITSSVYLLAYDKERQSKRKGSARSRRWNWNWSWAKRH